MKYLLFFLSFFLYFADFSFAQQDDSVTFEQVEQRLFPTWSPKMPSSGADYMAHKRFSPEALSQYEDLKNERDLYQTQLDQKITEREIALLKSDRAKNNKDSKAAILDSCLKKNGASQCQSEKTAYQTAVSDYNSAFKDYIATEKEVLSAKDKLIPIDQKIEYLFLSQSVDVPGVVGEGSDGKTFLEYIPFLTNILLKFVAPVILVVLVYAGLQFIYAGDNDKTLGEAKQTFFYVFYGFLVVVVSYSLLKALYFLFAS